MKRKIPASFTLFLLVIAITAFFTIVVSRWNIVESLRYKSIDGLFALRASVSPDTPKLKQVVVIGVDDESFKRMNRAWPWSRDIFAHFLDRLNVYRPKVVAFDFVFVGTDSYPANDDLWAESIRKAGNVILASYYGINQALVTPLPKFADSALALGLVDKPQDVDGVYRKSRSFPHADGDGFFSLAAEALYRSAGSSPAQGIHLTDRGVRYDEPGVADPKPGQSTFAQMDAKRRIWLASRHKIEKFQYVPFVRIFQKNIPPEVFKDKIVLVGPVSPVFHDIHPTPLGQIPGVFVIANELVALWDRDFVREPLAGREPWFIITLAALFTALIVGMTFAVQWIVFIGLSMLIYATCALLFCKYGILVEPFSPVVALTLSFVLVASWKALKTFLDNAALQRQVITDSLTGLYGHRFLTLKLGSIFLHALQEKTEFCVAMLDADHFKKVNDTYGHDVGNQVLIGITRVMKQHVRRQDIVARFGGEEFAVIMVGTDVKGAREGLERMRKAISDVEFSSDKGKFKVTISAGFVSNQNPAVKNSEDMLKLADKALYQAKAQGRNQVCSI